MNKTFTSVLGAAALCTLLLSATRSDNPITREGSTTVVNTTALTASIRGYADATPVKIYISAGKIVRVEALPNKETPRYFQKVKKELLPKWEGMSVNKALKAKVDGVSGATFSSEAVIKNVKTGLSYYKNHRK